MFKFSHIEAFHQVVRTADFWLDPPADLVAEGRTPLSMPVAYRGTLKLHGTNAGIACTPAGLQPQSRNRTLSLDEDNLGFAAFAAGAEQVAAVREIERDVRAKTDLSDDVPVVLFGEWVGPGVQRGVAVSQLPERQWVLFGVAAGEPSAEQGGLFDERSDTLRYLDVLEAFGDRFADARIYSVLDAPTFELEIDFRDRDAMKSALAQVDAWVAEVEEVCPWGSRFGVEGVGEGLVWMPTGAHWGMGRLFWKAKGGAHKKAKRPKVTVDPLVAESIEAFVELTVTEERLDQGIAVLKEMGKPVEMRSTGDFLKWVQQDIHREAAAELEASGLTWKEVNKAISQRALDFFKARVASF